MSKTNDNKIKKSGLGARASRRLSNGTIYVILTIITIVWLAPFAGITLDENLSPADRAIYERLHYEGLQKKVGAIFDRHNELSATDVRVISEYIQKTNDEALLAQLKEQRMKDI